MVVNAVVIFSAEGLTEKQIKVEVIGDLTEEEAKTFVLGDAGVKTDTGAETETSARKWPGLVHMGPIKDMLPDLPEDLWEKIYARCGGNIGLLEECVIEAAIESDWEKALTLIVGGPRSAVDKGFEPSVISVRDQPPLWTKDQWKKVLQCILEAKYHAVAVSDLVAALAPNKNEPDGAFSGKKVLLSMVKYNLLALRPASDLARDLPLEVYGKGKSVVTLVSPAHLWAAKDSRAEWDV